MFFFFQFFGIYGFFKRYNKSLKYRFYFVQSTTKLHKERGDMRAISVKKR